VARLIGSFVILVALVLIISSLATDNDLPSLANLFGQRSDEEEAADQDEVAPFSTASPGTASPNAASGTASPNQRQPVPQQQPANGASNAPAAAPATVPATGTNGTATPSPVPVQSPTPTGTAQSQEAIRARW
jgi:cell division septation protein DedD